MDNRAIINLDGGWGSGKTVVTKGLELLSTGAIKKLPNVNEDLVSEFREKYKVFYFNAWENDRYDPAEAIIFSLANFFWGTREKLSNNVLKLCNVALDGILGLASGGNLDSKSYREANDYLGERIKGLQSLKEKQEAAEDLVANGLGGESKTLLFVVDELDRCNPKFAIELLELIKHYFVNGRVLVLLVTNNSQLSYIIKHYYGNDFSASEYLDKIYDLSLSLPEVSAERYLTAYSYTVSEGLWTSSAIISVAEYFRLSLREMNRLETLFRVSSQFLEIAPKGVYDDYYNDYVRRIIVPLTLGAKIKDLDLFKKILSGEGVDELKRFYNLSKYARKTFQGIKGYGTSLDIDTTYIELFSASNRGNTGELGEARELLLQIVGLLDFVK